MDKQYWENYYKSSPTNEQPSLFAKFVFEKYISNKHTLIELGCGNGRDAIFFARNGMNVTAIDQCEDIHPILSKKYNLPNLKFKSADFTQLGEIGTFDCVYSRFTLHSISTEQENQTIAWVHAHLNKGGLFLIEARGQKNELYKVGESVPNEPHAFIHNNHYRRFVNKEELGKKLEIAGFTILLSEEDKGFAPHDNTNYYFMRKIAIKK